MGNLQNLLPRVSNPYAPIWVPFSPQRPGFRDEESDIRIPLNVTVPAGSTSLANVLAFDDDADFFVTEFWTLPQPQDANIAPTDIRIRIRDNDGRFYTDQFVTAMDINGPLAPPQPVKRGSVWLIDFMNVNASLAIEVIFVVRGYKRRLCENVSEAVESADRPMRDLYAQPRPGETFRDFEYPVILSNATDNTYLKLPVQTNNDADFFWRGVSGQYANPQNDAATIPGNVAVVFYNPNNLSLSDGAFPSPITGFGELHESVLSAGGGQLAPHYPEVFVPRGGVIQLDVYFNPSNAPGSLNFKMLLRGVKVYTKESC